MLDLRPQQAMPVRLVDLAAGQLFVSHAAETPVLAMKCDAGQGTSAWVTLTGTKPFSIIEVQGGLKVWALPYKPEALSFRFDLSSGKVSHEWARGLLMLSSDDGLGFSADWADAPNPDYLRGVAINTWSLLHGWTPRMTFSDWALCATTDSGSVVTLAEFKNCVPA